MIFLRQGGASWEKFVQLVLILVRQKHLKRGVERKMVFIAVQAVLGGSKPPAVDGSMVENTALALQRLR